MKRRATSGPRALCALVSIVACQPTAPRLPLEGCWTGVVGPGSYGLYLFVSERAGAISGVGTLRHFRSRTEYALDVTGSRAGHEVRFAFAGGPAWADRFEGRFGSGDVLLGCLSDFQPPDVAIWRVKGATAAQCPNTGLYWGDRPEGLCPGARDS